ncbi:MAG TPA: hypothetical protein VHC39_19630 [Rhizomicrobium sp.]|nr:hypothetical protein [Rhizomicrobium sp.]
MNPGLSEKLVWSAAAALGPVTLALLVRNILAIPAHVPLDPNEGWNAAHALAAMAGHDLYPPPQALMVNNYPPLSFYLIGFLARHGDAIVAGRWVALAAFLSCIVGIETLLRRMECGLRAIILGTLFFAALLLITSDYVGMDDPQLLGHALQLGALLLLLRERVMIAAALFAISLFIKHNLLAMPLAAGLWLLLQDRRTGLHFLLWGLAFALSGLVLFQLVFDTSLLDVLASPRQSSWANLEAAILHLWWAPLPILAMAGFWPDRHGLLCALYGGLALFLGLGFAAGDGVDANAFFDLGIALSLTLGLVVERGRWPVLAAASALPLLIFLAMNFPDNNFFFTRDFARTSARDIAFLKSRPGPALCDQLSLCLWAGKGAEVDVFNVGEAIKVGARDPKPLIHMIAARHFVALQLIDSDSLGPDVRRAIAQNYRADHSDDNGTFLVPLKFAL